MIRWYDTMIPYTEVSYEGIQYGVCREFNHISRYRTLRQVVHNPYTLDRFVALETPNAFNTNCEVDYYEVPLSEENRLDLIAHKKLGSPNYAWVISYFNRIEDGFTVKHGQTIIIPKSLTDLFNKGEILAPVNPLQLNLSSE